MKKVLFIDRDGTIIVEPADEQIDSLEKLEFLPFAISSLKQAQDMGFTLVMVTNQDGLGTASFPEKTFWPAHEKMLKILSCEGIRFDFIGIDRSFEKDKSENRKPGIGMLKEYLEHNKIDLDHSYTIGDRHTDVQLAKNLGCKSIFISSEEYHEADFNIKGWTEFIPYLRKNSGRIVKLERNTAETSIQLELNLDGQGQHQIDTGLKFYDHMLDQLSRHSGIDLKLKVNGDLEIDEHHTIEDSAIALGTALREALGDKRGLERYGFMLPMDDCLVQCSLDFSGRSWFVFHGSFDREYVGDFPTEMLEHWMKSFSDHAGINLHLQILEGSNTHHKIEASFKALARCLKQALTIKGDVLPSTKGLL